MMQKVLLLSILLVFKLFFGHAQAVNHKVENQNIQEFIQIWGLVKYRSQKSIAGKFDADNMFLNLIDSVKSADHDQFNQLMLRLTKDNTPKTTVSKQVYPKPKLIDGPYLTNNIDYDWIKNRKYNLLVKEQLEHLTNQINNSGQHHYVPSVFYQGDLPNEGAYKDYTFNKEAMNLLALAKAWNAIEYLFPYKYMIDKNWKNVLKDMIPFFRKINDRTSYEKGILMLEASINDTHAGGFMGYNPGSMQMCNTILNVRYYPPFDYIARENNLIITKFLNDSLAKNSTLKPGDEIITINGIKIKKWLKERSALLPASNTSVTYRELSTSNNFRGDAFAFSNLKNNSLKLKVKRQKTTFQQNLVMLDRKDQESIKIITSHIHEEIAREKALKGIENIGNHITVIRAGNVFDKDIPDDNDLEKLAAELKSKKALIFDMRKYPQSPGFFSYYIPMLLGKAPFQFARYYTVDLRQIGNFKFRNKLDTYMNVPKDGPKPIGDLYTGKIVILTNENTQSMGEWYTMMLRQFNSNTTVIGSQTAGADGDVKRITLPGDYQFSFTGNGIFYPDGRETQRVGIKPDIYFKPSAKELSISTDAQLQKAIKFIEEGL
ncbi:S41 family peptidase [Zhouia sp. PK063]|uniref:S41 family peptidase n=1 Tax=Zhouia sp. PK063 TaxID=3373602 RepID=UPI0037B8C996